MSHALDFKSLGSNKDAGLKQNLFACGTDAHGMEQKYLSTKQHCHPLLKLYLSPSVAIVILSSHTYTNTRAHTCSFCFCFTNWDHTIRDCASLLLIDKTISNSSQASPCHQYAHLWGGQYAQEPSLFVHWVRVYLYFRKEKLEPDETCHEQMMWGPQIKGSFFIKVWNKHIWPIFK